MHEMLLMLTTQVPPFLHQLDCEHDGAENRSTVTQYHEPHAINRILIERK